MTEAPGDERLERLTVTAVSTRLSGLAHEVGKFGVVGAVAYVVDVGLFNWLRFEVVIGPLKAKTLATLVAVTVAYLGNRYWTWRDRRQTGIRREYLMFAMVNGGGLAIQLACLAFTVYILQLDGRLAENIAGNVVGVVLGTLFRFWAYRTWVFPQLPPPEATDIALEETTVTPY